MNALTRCKCGHAHDNSASCEGVASSYREAQALIAADADFASCARDLMTAYLDARRYSKLYGDRILIWSAFNKAARNLFYEMEDLRCTIASERELWDGIDPADVHLMSVNELITNHQQGMRS
jgi:hypothetical protein